MVCPRITRRENRGLSPNYSTELLHRITPTIIFNGMLDKSAKFAGGLTDGRARRARDGTPTLPALAQGEFWARANGCSGPATRAEDNATLTV